MLWLVISNSASNYPLSRNSPHGNHYPFYSSSTAGAVRVVVAVGQSVLVRYGLVERALAAQRSKQLRAFRKLDTLMRYLQGIGMSRFEVDGMGTRIRGVTVNRRPFCCLLVQHGSKSVPFEPPKPPIEKDGSKVLILI